ncbi:Superkiller protein 3 [Fusarium equiseti]|uniref:Superkiller protein 3 n=1 Tax=Fusarium equiseti TaxID=61235 RepID=A0ABQ8RI42_FUSEQ|nr:Superkiller protein 3 [Fusarium equiseti]
MSGTKAALKGINDAIRQQKFDDAVSKAQELLEKDSKNYQAHIFLAFALDKKDRLDQAQETYRSATWLRPQEAQAWQGLIKLFEKQNNRKLTDYQQAVVNLAQIYRDADDMYKAQDVVDKFVDFARVKGDDIQYAEALSIQLPESPLYPVLEGRFPHPARTYETIALILEKYEKHRINTLIGERRTKLGAKLSEVTLEAKREVYSQSKLEHIYRQLINWTNDDDLRRQYEEKLLQLCYDRLQVASPGADKDTERQKVLDLANGMVAIKYPHKLAWDISIEWQDKKEIREWDVDVLRAYCSFFPDSDLYKVITSFLTSPISPFPPEKTQEKAKAALNDSDESSDDDDGGVPTLVVPLTDEDRLIMITEGITTADSVLAYRLTGQYLLHIGEYESTVELMRKGMALLAQERKKTGLSFVHAEDSYYLSLGTALVYYQSPRHHKEAKELFDKVLERDTTSTSALIGVGLIYEEEEEYDEAIDYLTRALERDQTNIRVKSEAAWVKALKGDWGTARDELKECLEPLEKQGAASKELLGETQHRLGVCIWNIDTSKAARKQRKGESAYAYWLSALNNHLNHAPTYTYLGTYYADYAKDKGRSRRCFQKALELSHAEVVAAESLARSFADDGDWDRVELVARRVVDSGKVKPPPGSKRKGISWPFAALGVAELNKQDFHKAIVSFQAALRISPEDYHSWVGLGESYHSSGRHIAATKAILNAQKLEEETKADVSGDTWFTKYMLANIKRELGEYDESIALYRSVIETHPEEEGVIIALLQTTVDSALSSVEKGLFGKAVQLATETIEYSKTTSGSVFETFNFWKAIGDACSVYSSVQSRTCDFPRDSIRSVLEKGSQEAYEIFADIDNVGTDVIFAQGLYADDEQPGVDLTRCIHATILCHKQGVHIASNDRHAQSVAYYNLGWAEYRAHICLPPEIRKKSSSYIKAAVRSFKRAIELEAGNSDFWNALGVVTSEINPSVSQHAFARSLYLNERSPAAWTNLGTLALLSGDVQLANEVFTRAQSTDPDYAHAWLGQGFVALLHGDTKEARGLFTHAMEIADASSVPTRRHYSSALFDHILTVSPNELNVESLIQPLFALNQYQSLKSQDLAFAHLATLFQERTNESNRAVETLEKISSTVEADFESTESPESLAKFALAKTDLARTYLASGSYEEAIECGETALGLSSDEAENELSSEQRKQARLSAHLTVGLAQYYNNEFDKAIGYFESALEESDGNPDAVCLLAQVLWAEGSEESRDRAREKLFETIEQHPDHVQSVLLLGVIALLDNDEDSLEAVVEELYGLRTNHKVTASEQSNIGEVLRAIATLGEGRTEDDMKTQLQTDIMLHPNLPHGWAAMAQSTGDKHAAQMALKVATRGIPPKGLLDAQDLSRAYAGTATAGDAQRAAFLAPWEQNGWSSLAVATEGI